MRRPLPPAPPLRALRYGPPTVVSRSGLARVRLAALPVLLLSALPLSACGGDEPSAPLSAEAKKAREAAAEAEALLTTYPVRDVFVAFKPAPKDGVAVPPRTEAEALRRAREIATRLRAPGADFGQLAREMSDDPTTIDTDGFVGFVSGLTGEDEVLLERTAALPIGKISEPIHTPQGLHVIQRLTREEGKALESRVFVPYEGLLIPSTSQMSRGLPATQTQAWAREEAVRALGALRAGTATLERLAEPIAASRVLRDVIRGNPNPGFQALSRALRSAEVGAWGEPVDTPDGIVVFRRLPYIRASVRHLVVTHIGSAKSRRVTPRLTEDAERIAREAKRRLDADPSSWDRVVAEVSEEPGTKDFGGFMGDIANTTRVARRYPPEIETAVWALAPGETSDVVATRFGFHIFRRID